MLSDEEIEAVAQDYVRRAYAADREIFHRENRSEPDGIFFVAKGSLPGDGGFFVTRASGEIWHFGSGQFGLHGGLENLLKWYAEGWRPGGYRLTVREVNDPVQLARLLVKHGVFYLLRELEHGVVWDTPGVRYDEDLVLRRLKELPCTFIVFAEQMSAMLPALKAGAVARFDYARLDAPPKKYDWRPEKNTPEQLGPQFEWV